MARFRALFSFTDRQVKRAFERATFRAKIPGLTLLQAPGEQGLPHGKLLIVIPKATGPAARRNRLRRQARAAFYEEKLYKSPAVSILLVYKEAFELSFGQIKNFLVKQV